MGREGVKHKGCDMTGMLISCQQELLQWNPCQQTPRVVDIHSKTDAYQGPN